MDDQTFIAMEFIEGQSLQDIVGAQHAVPLPLDDAIDYATQTAAGLQAAMDDRVSVANQMTPSQIAKARELALEWLAKHDKN